MDGIPSPTSPGLLPCLKIDFCVIGLWCSTLYLSRAVPHYSCIFSDGIYGCHWFAGTKLDLRDAAHSEPHSKPRNSALVVISTELDHQKDWIEKTWILRQPCAKLVKSHFFFHKKISRSGDLPSLADGNMTINWPWPYITLKCNFDFLIPMQCNHYRCETLFFYQ